MQTRRSEEPAATSSGSSPLAVARCVYGAAGDGLVNVEVAVADLQVEATVRVGANPRLEVNRRALAAEVRQRHKVAGLALLAPRKVGIIVHYRPRTSRFPWLCESICSLYVNVNLYALPSAVQAYSTPVARCGIEGAEGTARKGSVVPAPGRERGRLLGAAGTAAAGYAAEIDVAVSVPNVDVDAKAGRGPA